MDSDLKDALTVLAMMHKWFITESRDLDDSGRQLEIERRSMALLDRLLPTEEHEAILRYTVS